MWNDNINVRIENIGQAQRVHLLSIRGDLNHLEGKHHIAFFCARSTAFDTRCFFRAQRHIAEIERVPVFQPSAIVVIVHGVDVFPNNIGIPIQLDDLRSRVSDPIRTLAPRLRKRTQQIPRFQQFPMHQREPWKRPMVDNVAFHIDQKHITFAGIFDLAVHQHHRCKQCIASKRLIHFPFCYAIFCFSHRVTSSEIMILINSKDLPNKMAPHKHVSVCVAPPS